MLSKNKQKISLRMGLARILRRIPKFPTIDVYITETGVSLQDKALGVKSNLVVTHLVNEDFILTTNNPFSGVNERQCRVDVQHLIELSMKLWTFYGRGMDVIDDILSKRETTETVVRSDKGFMVIRFKFNHSKRFEIS